MKRDMDLVRKIMIAVEEGDPAGLRRRPMSVEGYEPAIVAGHVKIMHQAGLVEAFISEPDGQPPRVAMVYGLTWGGHEWLEVTRSETIWAKTKQWAAEKGGGASFEVLKTIALKLVLTQLGLPGGI
jgi:hypothetical protein